LLQSLEKRVRRRSGLCSGGLLVAARGLGLWIKLFRIPEVDMESFDLFDEHQNCAARRGNLYPFVVGQAVTPTPKRLELVLIEG